MYFDTITDLTELEAQHRTLTKQYHPDGGGNAEDFKIMQLEYEHLKSILEGTAATEAQEKKFPSN